MLRFLIGQGYQFCLSKTSSINTPNANVCVTLTPVKCTQAICNREGFDNFFAIKAEPAYLSRGVDRTLILVDMNTATMFKYKTSIFLSLKSGQHLD
ncbi:MAG: hypothetical protein EOP46_04155 [Sphingobacteriaceae bacterium]|nr:MAG: hypothetical protein EOP46_04155 [Sphingobacteriaceae bacterium]